MDNIIDTIDINVTYYLISDVVSIWGEFFNRPLSGFVGGMISGRAINIQQVEYIRTSILEKPISSTISVLALTNHRLGHLNIHIFSLHKLIFVGSKHPKKYSS